MFTANTTTAATPDRVLDVLTDPDAIRDWSPVPFELDGFDGARLVAGSTAHVKGRLGGISVGFDVAVTAADADRLELAADGPIGLDVRYDLASDGAGSRIDARVSVRKGRGLTGRMIAKATEALLAAGALDGAAGRIARVAETEPAFVAA